MMVVSIIKIRRLFSPRAVWGLVISMAGVAREPWARPTQAERAKDILTIHHKLLDCDRDEDFAIHSAAILGG